MHNPNPMYVILGIKGYNNNNKVTGKGMGQLQYDAGGGDQMGGFVNQTMRTINDIAGLGQLVALGTQIAAAQSGNGSPPSGAVAGIRPGSLDGRVRRGLRRLLFRTHARDAGRACGAAGIPGTPAGLSRA